jgi:hypothetical protein
MIKMRKVVALGLAVLMLLVIVVTPAFAAKPGNPDDGYNGNGAPSGPHYNLNIIGTGEKDADMTGNNGHRIFVKLTGNTKIMLSEGDFQVLDANGTDGEASFQLPLPAECYATVDPDTGDVVTPDTCIVRYTVWVRPLGMPGGKANMKTCAVDDAGVTWCSDPDWWVEVERKNGQSKFTNVSRELLFVSTDIDADGKVEHIQLFDPLLEDYYWDYNNQGLKLLQMRFYEGDYEIKW